MTVKTVEPEVKVPAALFCEARIEWLPSAIGMLSQVYALATQVAVHSVMAPSTIDMVAPVSQTPLTVGVLSATIAAAAGTTTVGMIVMTTLPFPPEFPVPATSNAAPAEPPPPTVVS